MADDMKVFERTLERNGWRAEVNGNGHRKWTSPDGAVVTASMTPSDGFRAITNTVRELKALGYGADGTKLPDADERKAALEAAAAEARRRDEENRGREERRLFERVDQSLGAQGVALYDQVKAQTGEEMQAQEEEKVAFWKRYGNGATQSAPPEEPKAVIDFLETGKFAGHIPKGYKFTPPDDVLQCRGLQYVVEDPPTRTRDFESANKVRRERAAERRRVQTEQKRVRAERDAVLARQNVVPAPERPHTGTFSVEGLMGRAVQDTPQTAFSLVWIKTLNQLPDTEWYKFGEFGKAETDALLLVCANKRYECQTQGGSDRSKKTIWARRTR